MRLARRCGHLASPSGGSSTRYHRQPVVEGAGSKTDIVSGTSERPHAEADLLGARAFETRARSERATARPKELDAVRHELWFMARTARARAAWLREETL